MMAEHLWQSTLFALVAGLSTLVLRKNRAGHRYWLWLAASLKFLVPFSLLTGLGSHLARIAVPGGTQAWLAFAVNPVSQPFAQGIVPGDLRVLAAVWLCGSAVVLATWYWRWRSISAAIRQAVPLRAGREVDALRRMERLVGIRRPIPIVSSPAFLEPGIFGMVSPVLLWPQGISAHLGDAHLQAVVAHEVWHVRRRDNLAAALHMVVEAAFWFHPLVWWLEARLVAEREGACDEKVLELGSERRIYAESILRICQFCAGFPLACVSGVTGADLKKRIVAIMTEDVSRELNFCKKLWLCTAGLAVIAAPTLAGSLGTAPARATEPSKNPDGSSSMLAALRANRDTPADTTMLQLLQAASVTGATCPNAIPTAQVVP
jgi:beta-lactamase regulating signal transducer with metallopeptidase domain